LIQSPSQAISSLYLRGVAAIIPFEFMYETVGATMAEYLGMEVAFGLRTLSTRALNPGWLTFCAQQQESIRLLPAGSFFQAALMFTKAARLEVVVRNENQAAAIGLRLAQLPLNFRMISYSLEAWAFIFESLC
jgi:hypothetical protein